MQVQFKFPTIILNQLLKKKMENGKLDMEKREKN